MPYHGPITGVSLEQVVPVRGVSLTRDVLGALTTTVAIAGRAAGRGSARGTITANVTGVLAGMSAAPRACYSVWRLLISGYGGPLIEVRKTTGLAAGSVLSIGYVAATGLLDATALAAFVGSDSWTISILYDQSGNGRNLTSGGTGLQPVGGTSGTAVTLSSHQAGDFDGTDDALSRADAFGLSGSTALSVYVAASFDVASSNYIWGIGGTSAGTELRLLATSATQLNATINGSNRIFTATSLTTGTHKLLTILGASAGIGTAVQYQNGTLLSEASTSNPSNVLSLGTTSAVLGSEPGLATYHNGKIAEWFVWNSVLSAGDIAIVNAL